MKRISSARFLLLTEGPASAWFLSCIKRPVSVRYLLSTEIPTLYTNRFSFFTEGPK